MTVAASKYILSFIDVTQNDYYYYAVAWTVGNAVTVGTTETTFAPENTCTRAQTVSFLYRYTNAGKSSTTNPFTDVLPTATTAGGGFFSICS